MRLLSKLLLICLLFAPMSLMFQTKGGPSILAFAEEEAGDILEGEEDGNVDEDGPQADAVLKDEEDDDAPGTIKPHPDADTVIFFTKPAEMKAELPVGRDVQFLVGFTNKGSKDFLIESMDASFRYAMDFNYHLQNFSAIGYNRLVKPKEETTLSYSFFVSEAYSARPYGLTVNMFYKDGAGNQYAQAVYNETVTIVELDEGLDGETFFLYLFLAALMVLLLVGIQQYISSKTRISIKPKIERGTSNDNDVDYDWLPPETLQALNKSPKAPKQSPRQRRMKRGTGSADD